MTVFRGLRNRLARAVRATVGLLTAVVLAVAGLAGGVVTPAVAAGGITLEKTGPGTVWPAGTASFTLAASNPAEQPGQYNLSYSDAMPVGLLYVGGSTTPSSFGEPQVITRQVLVEEVAFDQQTLIWSKVSDLTPGSTVALHFDARVDAAVFPIGSTVTNTGSAFSSSDPGEAPEFDSEGTFRPGKETVSATDSSKTTVTAIQITKVSATAGDGTPENELLRGVNDHQTVYALTVTNNGIDASESLLVTDFLPAGMEFLGCGGAFNGAKPEYDGASNTVDKVAECLQPLSVATVEDPADYPRGVYTQVSWRLDRLAAGERFVVRYAAGIPQQANTMDFAGGTPATDGPQTANLDNNNGAPTVETTSELALQNYAEVAGDFKGAAVADTTTHNVTAEDLRIVKDVDPKRFNQGGVATYTLVVDTSEYADATDLVITDELPAGLCPLRTSDPGYTPPVAECDLDLGEEPTNARITGVRTNPDGSFTLTITPDRTSLDANGHLVITYQAFMREYYDLRLTGLTSEKDSFTNTARIDGTTTPPPKVDAPTKEPQSVSDESRATIFSGGPELTKLRMPNQDPMTCSNRIGDYVPDPKETPFTEGDRVCFFLRLQFPDGVDTLSSQLSDFLPTNLTFESAKVVTGEGLVSDTVPTRPTSYVSWILGSGTPRVVAKGSVFEVVLSAIVSKPPALTAPPRALDQENLAEFQYTNASGGSQSLRDVAPVPLAPPPAIGITKGVQAVNSTVIDGGSTPGNVDGTQVRIDDRVVFRIDLQNLATPGEVNADPILAPEVWDVLPTGVTCASVDTISDAGACYDADNPGRPNVAGNATASVIRWQLTAAFTLAPQAFGKLTFTMTVPSGAGVSARLENTAAVASFRTATNLGEGSTGAVHNPASNIDAGVPSRNFDVPAASDTSWTATLTVGATIAKAATPTSLTIGQRDSWTVTATVPANGNYYDASIVDVLPDGVDLASLTTDSISCALTGGSCTVSGASLTATNAGKTIGWFLGDLTVSAQVRTVTIVYSGRIADIAGNTAGTSRTNSAAIRWNLANKTNPTTTGAVWDQTSTGAAATVTVTEPALAIAKTVDDTTVEPGQTFTYTVTVTNNGRAGNLSPAHNITVVDTIPTGVVVNPATISGGGLLAGTGTNGGGTITWTVPGPLAANAATNVIYRATLASSATLTTAGRTNTADITRYESLPGGRVYDGPTASQAVTPQFPHVTPTKSVSAGPAYFGKPKTWTLTVTSDGNATARGVDIVDTLPPNWTYDADSASIVLAGAAATLVEPTLSTALGSQVLTWTNAGSIPATGANRTMVITFTATPQYPAAAADPGVGSIVNHTNTVAVVAEDATGATGNASGAYNAGPASAITQIDSADLQVTKTSGDAVAGSDLVYSLVVKNNGPDTAVGPFPLVDTLPDGVGSLSWTGTGWSCSVAAATVSCTRTNPANNLAAGASFPVITIAVSVPAAAASGTVLMNTVAVASTTFDPNTANNTDQVSNTVTRAVDLGIAKAISGPITAGEDATYTLDVTNHVPSDTTGPVTVTDTLPSGTSFVSAEGNGWDCLADGLALTCTRTAGLDNSQAAPQITVVVHVPAGRTADVINSAAVDGPEPDPNPANDTARVTDPVRTFADLALTKVHQAAFVPGRNGTYQLTVMNNGPSDAAAPARITDQLPPGLSFVSDNSNDWSCSANASNVVTCSLIGDLPAGDTSPFAVTVAIDQAPTGDITNTATVGSSTDDPHLSNNTDTDNTGVSVRADLSITKSHAGDATAGQDLDFTLEVTNHGNSDSPGPIAVSDTLPAGLTYRSATGAGWSCSTAGQVISCTHGAGLAAGASRSISLRAAVAADAGPAQLTNRASVSGMAPDLNPDNDTAEDVVTVLDRANVHIVKTATPTTVLAGNQVRYTLTVTNDGPSDADNVNVADPLPPGLQFVAVEAAQFTCTDANPVDCHLADMPAGASYSIVITATVGSAVADSATIVNQAQVSTSTLDDDPDDNTDTATIGVATSADLRIAKTHPVGPVPAGEQVTFDLAVHNDGPSYAAADLVVTDTLPDGMSYLSNTGPWTCTPAGDALGCVLDDSASVPAGTDAPSLTVTAHVDANLNPGSLVDGKVTNTAVVTSATTDPDPGNNSDADPVTVEFHADLSITKAHTLPARVGDPLTFTLAVANAGPSAARTVTAVDTLPAGLEFVSAVGTGWICTHTGQRVDCSLANPLPAAAAAPDITITVNVLSSAFGGVLNTASVDAATPDPVADNNAALDAVTVPAQVDLGITKSHAPEPLQVGDQTTYTLGVSNAGATDDPGPVTVIDVLPAGLTFISGTGDGWGCAAAAQEVTCTRADGLQTTATTTISLLVTVGPAAYPAVTNTATVASPAEDTNPDNNAASDPATVLASNDLTLVKELASITGSRADWTLTVTNHGLNPASVGSVGIVDDMPDELSLLGFAGDQWTCAPQGQQVVCSYGADLAAGDATSLTLQTGIDPKATGTITNSASIIGGMNATAQGRIPPDDGGLASTGGLATGAGLLGLLSMLIGAGLLSTRSRRNRDRPNASRPSRT